MKLKIPKRRDGITVLFFQLCVISNNVLGSDSKLYMISKILTLAFFAVVLLRILYKGKVKLNQILLLPALFTLYCTASILWARNATVAQDQMITQVQLLLLLLFAYWSMNDGVTVLDYLKAMYLSGFGMVLFALMRYGGVEQYTDALLNGERMGDEIANLNTFGMLFANAALSSAYYFILKKKKIHIVSFALFSFFALSSASRKAMLMIVMGVIAISVIHYGIRRIYRTLILAAVVTVAVILALRLPYFAQISNRLEKLINGEQTASDKERQAMINYGLQLFKEKPLQGYGIDNFRAIYIRGTYSHNNYIELLVSGGVVALVLYYMMFLVPAVGLLLCRKKGEELPHLHLMLWVWLIIELVFGVAMVQVYNKNSWLMAGVLMAEVVRATDEKRKLQEGTYELDQ